MEFNPDIIETLRSHRIDKNQGLLVLLGYYFKLDIDNIASEEVIKAVSVTKIVVKDHDSNSITWNIGLFKNIESSFEWVRDWVEKFGEINPERKGDYRDATTRMKEFFRKYPEYRKDDVYAARDLYFQNIPGGRKYCMHSHKFIFDGAGAMKKSTLLQWCGKVKEGSSPTGNDLQRGQVLS